MRQIDDVPSVSRANPVYARRFRGWECRDPVWAQRAHPDPSSEVLLHVRFYCTSEPHVYVPRASHDVTVALCVPAPGRMSGPLVSAVQRARCI